MNRYYLGIDTSAYTTSISLLNSQNHILMDLRRTLIVDKDKKGLRQQEALFQHLNNFPLLIESLAKEFDLKNVDTISVSAKPRNNLDSYMPVFLFGKNQAYILSQALGTSYKEFSHQEGHIATGLISHKELIDKSFISLHISGGTSEILRVENLKDNLQIELVGGTLDLNFGQLIDRIGTFLKYDFPCGKKMDEISKTGQLLHVKIPINIKDRFWTSISGLENYFQRLITSGKYLTADIILTLFHTIAMFLEVLILNVCRQYNLNYILITGGVSANTYIRKYLIRNLDNKNINIIFPEINLSTDNAVGTAYLGKNKKGHFSGVGR